MNMGRMGKLARLGATTAQSTSTAALTTQITDIYQTYFGRAPEAAGLAFWIQAVQSGNVADASLPLAIVQSAAAPDKAYFMTNFPNLVATVYGTSTTPAATVTPGTAAATTTAATTTTAASTGMDTNTIMILIVAGLGLWYLMKEQ